MDLIDFIIPNIRFIHLERIKTSLVKTLIASKFVFDVRFLFNSEGGYFSFCLTLNFLPFIVKLYF